MLSKQVGVGISMIVADGGDEIIMAVLIAAYYHSSQEERFSWAMDRTAGIFFSSRKHSMPASYSRHRFVKPPHDSPFSGRFDIAPISSGKSAPIVPNRNQPPFVRKDIICSRPAAQGRPVARQLGLARRGSRRSGRFLRLGRTVGRVAPLRVFRCGGTIAPTSVFTAIFGQSASRSVSGSGPGELTPLMRGRLQVRHFGASALASCPRNGSSALCPGHPRLRYLGCPRRHMMPRAADEDIPSQQPSGHRSPGWAA